jgi:hypothetical protein
MAIISIIILILFWLVIATNTIAALAFGLRAERAFAVLLLLSSFSSTIAHQLFGRPDWSAGLAFAADWTILFAALWLALRSDRHWPLWFAGLQALTVINDLLAWSEIGARYRFLANLSAAWALPAMIAMTCGILLDWRCLRRPAPGSA